MADCQAAMLKCQEAAHKAQSELRQNQKRLEELSAENSRLSSLVRTKRNAIRWQLSYVLELLSFLNVAVVDRT